MLDINLTLFVLFLCFFSILMLILCTYICSKMAGERNRDRVIGGILGAMFGIWAIIGYAIAGEKKIKEDL